MFTSRYLTSRKMIPFTLDPSALIGAGASIINGIGNLFGVSKSNKTNREIAAMTNATNERINQSQLDYNWQMWHAQNEYNNPAAQRKRLTDAGLNPIYYGLDGNSAASGNSFSPIAAQQASPTIPQNFDFVSDAAMKYAQIQNMQADTNLKNAGAGLDIEKAESERQLRSGMLTIQGQNIRLNENYIKSSAKEIDKLAADIRSINQSVEESLTRVNDLRSQISQREFEKRIRYAEYLLDRKYKNGLLTLQEKNLALGWFNAFTDRKNANTNYYNVLNQNFRENWMLPYNQRQSESISQFNENNAEYIKSQNKREQDKFTLEQISRAADAYKSACTSLIYSQFTHPLGRYNFDTNYVLSRGKFFEWLPQDW